MNAGGNGRLPQRPGTSRGLAVAMAVLTTLTVLFALVALCLIVLRL